MKRYRIVAISMGCTYQFEIEIPEGIDSFYHTDNTSMEFKATDGYVYIFPRLETIVQVIPLIPETTWKEPKIK